MEGVKNMAQVTKQHNEMLAALQKKLNNHMLHDWLVFIHITTPCMNIHHAIHPDIACVNGDEVELASDHFELHVSLQDSDMFNIQNDTHGYCITADQVAINVDFSH